MGLEPRPLRWLMRTTLPSIAAARADAQAADHQARVRKGALLPTVSLEASYENRRGDSASYGSSEEASLLARLTFPLFESGGRLSRIREANSQSVARHYDHAQARSVTAARVTAAFRRRIAASKSQLRVSP